MIDFDKYKTSISLPDFLKDVYGFTKDDGSSQNYPKFKRRETGEVLVVKKNHKGHYTYFNVHDDNDSCVVSVARFTAGNTDNILPQSAELEGTPALSPAVRDLAERRFREIVAGFAAASGVTATLDYRRNYPVKTNPANRSEFAAAVARQAFGADNVQTDQPPVMGAEDFSFMLEARPGAFVWLGNGDSAGLHHPEYDFNDAALPYGIAYFARIVETALAA